VRIRFVVTAELVERRTEIHVRVDERWVDGERTAIMLDRLFDRALRLERDREIVVRIGEHGVQLQRVAIAVQRQFALAACRRDEAAVAPAIGIRRIERQRAIEQSRRGAMGAALMQQHAVVMQRFRMVRDARERFAVESFGFVEIAGAVRIEREYEGGGVRQGRGARAVGTGGRVKRGHRVSRLASGASLARAPDGGFRLPTRLCPTRSALHRTYPKYRRASYFAIDVWIALIS
jgi:hypothetical protein